MSTVFPVLDITTATLCYDVLAVAAVAVVAAVVPHPAGGDGADRGSRSGGWDEERCQGAEEVKGSSALVDQQSDGNRCCSG
ncbi:MAG: hypothetical protein MZW92_21730 [Comamonadaceae bacterium]|nr:hypothetical protein [Comamonadaceae bacterium]